MKAYKEHNYPTAIGFFEKISRMKPTEQISKMLADAYQKYKIHKNKELEEISKHEQELKKKEADEIVCKRIIGASTFLEAFDLKEGTNMVKEISKALKSTLRRIHPDKTNAPSSKEATQKLIIIKERLENHDETRVLNIRFENTPNNETVKNPSSSSTKTRFSKENKDKDTSSVSGSEGNSDIDGSSEESKSEDEMSTESVSEISSSEDESIDYNFNQPSNNTGGPYVNNYEGLDEFIFGFSNNDLLDTYNCPKIFDSFDNLESYLDDFELA